MSSHPRIIALLLAFSVALITTAFLSLVTGTSWLAIVVACIMSFASTFILTYITLEFLIFREINKIYAEIGKINSEDPNYTFDIKQSTNPFRRVKDDMLAYANRKQKEIDELKKLETFRREFIADISHELKTPLFAAQGFILTLLDGAINDEAVREKFLKKAAKSLSGLDSLIRDLLTLSQIESGDITMHYEVFDVVEVALEVFEQFEEKAAKKFINLHFAEDYEDAILVHADQKRITQVLNNLVSNAIKYSNEHCTVTLRFEDRHKFVEVFVIDNGHGIPKEDVKRIFERFYRVEKSRSKKQGGTGLGLAIVKHILEKHQSKVVVSSELGEGTIFSFKLEKGY